MRVIGATAESVPVASWTASMLKRVTGASNTGCRGLESRPPKWLERDNGPSCQSRRAIRASIQCYRRSSLEHERRMVSGQWPGRRSRGWRGSGACEWLAGCR